MGANISPDGRNEDQPIFVRSMEQSPMNRYQSQPIARIQPLPEGFPPALREIDARLAQRARRLSVPVGLADRVFAASIEALSQSRPLIESRSRLRFVPAEPRPLHHMRWARLAMAASVVIACSVGVWLMPAPVGPTGNFVARSDSTSDFFHDSLESTHSSAASHYEANLGYLRETIALTPEDLKNELTTLVSLF